MYLNKLDAFENFNVRTVVIYNRNKDILFWEGFALKRIDIKQYRLEHDLIMVLKACL